MYTAALRAVLSCTHRKITIFRGALKPGALNAEEWSVMYRHPKIGADIIGQHDSELLILAASVSLTHHEKWDGSGYPRGLMAEEIPLEGRIVAIADVFDALTTTRPYKTAWSVEEAIELLKRDAGSHFDPTLVELFLEQLPALLEVHSRWADDAQREYLGHTHPLGIENQKIGNEHK
jgi:putative two-component system response regulator